MEDNKNRRKNYYIRKEFQRNFIFKFCFLVLAGSAISACIIYVASRATVTTSFDNLRLVIRSTSDYIMPSVLLGSIVVIIVTGIATIAITLFTSHKIAGPLYRIEQDINKVASGNLRQEFSLREHDEIRPIAEALNSMTGLLKGEISELKKSVDEMETLASSKNAPQEIRDKIKSLRARLENFKT